MRTPDPEETIMTCSPNVCSADSSLLKTVSGKEPALQNCRVYLRFSSLPSTPVMQVTDSKGVQLTGLFIAYSTRNESWIAKLLNDRTQECTENLESAEPSISHVHHPSNAPTASVIHAMPYRRNVEKDQS